MLLIVVGAIGLISSLLSCKGTGSGSYVDLTATNHSESLPTPGGEYLDSVAWLKGNQLAFLYAPTPPRGLWDYQIFVHTLGTEEWRALLVPQSTKCVSEWNSHLRPLPNNNLGFIHRCNNRQATAPKYILYMWDKEFETLQVLQSYPVPFHATNYAFAPDMSELIHEQDGGGLRDQLYRVSQDEHMEQLFADYLRVSSPAWSPDGSTIAFVGTETGPEATLSPFTGSEGIGSLLFYPWDLYLMDADGSNLRIIQSGIQLAAVVKWSPKGDVLAFAGEYEGEKGIWVLNIVTSQLTRVWPDIRDYDWSPDGQQMVVIGRTVQDSTEITHPIIFDVPTSAK